MRTARLTSGQHFPIGKILCIGHNYAEHIKELGNATPEAPVIFIKPASSVIGEGEAIVIPSYSHDCHHEAELALLIGRKGKDIPVNQAMESIAGYGVGIDLPLRDVQGELKMKGLPWEIAKGFDTACPLSDFVEASDVADPQNLQIRLTVNGERRQDGNTSMMIHRIPAIISHMSGIFTLELGDVILRYPFRRQPNRLGGSDRYGNSRSGYPPCVSGLFRELPFVIRIYLYSSGVARKTKREKARRSRYYYSRIEELFIRFVGICFRLHNYHIRIQAGNSYMTSDMTI